MKDEEMAEEYKEKHICSTCADIQDCGNDCPFSRCGVQAFLAGLKAGRPQWHDLRKDPNDLPICNKSGISTAKMTDKGKWAIYISSRKGWYTKLSDKIDVCQWCDLELPTSNEGRI